MKPVRYQSESKADAIFALSVLSAALGVPFAGGSKTAEEFYDRHKKYCLGNPIIGNVSETIDAWNEGAFNESKDYALFIDIGEAIRYIAQNKRTISVVLNSEYTAVVSSDEVTVGCQKFTHAKILELADAVKNINKS